jgi:hypothetical protein
MENGLILLSIIAQYAQGKGKVMYSSKSPGNKAQLKRLRKRKKHYRKPNKPAFEFRGKGEQ